VSSDLKKFLTLAASLLAAAGTHPCGADAQLEQHTVINTLKCAGNGRAFALPHLPGMQWEKGAARQVPNQIQ